MKKQLIALVAIAIMAVPVLAATSIFQGSSTQLTAGTYCFISSLNNRYYTQTDTDPSDNKLLLEYGAYKLIAPNGTVVASGLEPLRNYEIAYRKSMTFVASQVGTYRLTTNIFYVQQTYDKTTSTWVTQSSGSCGIIPSSSSVTVVANPVPSLPQEITNLFNAW